jgi:hypothetical protein
MDPITMGLALAAGYYAARRMSKPFFYRYGNGSWRAYFNGKPPSMSHVLHDSDGYYVCWDTPLRTKEQAEQVAREWMEIYG